MAEDEIPENTEEQENSEEEQEDSDEDEEDKKSMEEPDEEEDNSDLYKSDDLDEIEKHLEENLDEKDKEIYSIDKANKEEFGIQEKEDGFHPGFVASFSFGEQDYDRLHLLLIRLDEVAEKVMTYRKENMIYFPEFYSILYNLFISMRFLIDSKNRKRIVSGFEYLKIAVWNFSSKKTVEYEAFSVIEQIYLLLTNIRNLHGLGFSYEKKKGESERYVEAFFRKKLK